MFEKITRLKYSKIGGDMTNVRRVREMWEEYENFFLYFLYRHISRIILVYPCDIPCTLITFLISSSHFLYPGRKMSPIFGDISPKYLVSMGIDTIFLAEISARWFFGINLEKSAIYRDISAILARNRRFFSIYRLVNAGSTESTRYSESQCATVSPLQCTSQTICFCFRGDLNPKPFGLGFSLLANWANSPLWYKVH